VQDLIRHFPTRPTTSGSRNELVVGEVVRAMARLGHPSVLFRIRETHQVLSFRTVNHTHLSALHVTIDRPTGTTALSTAMFGNQVRLQVVAEHRQRLSHPTDLLNAARAQSTPSVPELGVRLEQEHSSMLASTHVDIDIDQLRTPSDNHTAPLETLMRATIHTLEAVLKTRTEHPAPSSDPPAAQQP
jgi:hypothetical protein